MTPAGMTVILALKPIDMRCSFDGLARAVQEQLGRDARLERTMFLFVNRRRDLLKLLWRDATGWCLLAKRLDENVVALPREVPAGTTSIPVDGRALSALLDGVVRPRRETARSISEAARESLKKMEITTTSTQPQRK